MGSACDHDVGVAVADDLGGFADGLRAGCARRECVEAGTLGVELDGQMPARQTGVKAGIGWDVPTLTINKMCLSGIVAIALADQLIRAGEFDCVVAGGQESMTQAPHLLPGSRDGFKW